MKFNSSYYSVLSSKLSATDCVIVYLHIFKIFFTLALNQGNPHQYNIQSHMLFSCTSRV